MKITAAQLISGQAEIDRMRGEIRFVTTCIAGLLKSTDVEPASNFRFGRAPLSIRAGGCVWVVKVADCKTGAISLRCIVSMREMFSTQTSVPVPVQYVRDMHDSLDALLQGMAEWFPALEERLAPQFEVAKQE